jgi:hypothetical protein
MYLYMGGETGYTDYPALAAVVHQPEVFEPAGIRGLIESAAATLPCFSPVLLVLAAP